MIFLKHNVAVSLSDDALPTRIRLFAVGVNETSKGDFTYDVSLKDAINEHMNGWPELAFDVDHLSLNDTASPEARRSVGWFKVSADDEGIWATDIEWTSSGAALLKDRAFRFVSPAFLTDEDGRITKIINCALTNQPATLDMAPIIASHLQETPSMAKKTKAEEDAKPTNEEPKQLAEDPKVDDDETKPADEGDSDELPPMTDEEKDAAISALQSQVTALQSEIDALRTENASLKDGDKEEVDESATKESIAATLTLAGHLTPSLKSWFLALPLPEVQAFAKLKGSDPAKALVKTRTAIRQPSEVTPISPKAITLSEVAPPTVKLSKEQIDADPELARIYRSLRAVKR